MFRPGERVYVCSGENPAYISTGVVKEVLVCSRTYIVDADCGDCDHIVADEDELFARPSSSCGGLKLEWYGRLWIYDLA